MRRAGREQESRNLYIQQQRKKTNYQCCELHLHTLHLLRNFRNPSAIGLLLLRSYPGLELINKRREVDQDTFLVGVTLWETHFLDLDLSGGHLVLTQDDTEGNTALLGSLELLRKLGLELVGEFGL